MKLWLMSSVERKRNEVREVTVVNTAVGGSPVLSPSYPEHLRGDTLEHDVLDDDVLEHDALEHDALEHDALERDTLADGVLEDDAHDERAAGYEACPSLKRWKLNGVGESAAFQFTPQSCGTQEGPKLSEDISYAISPRVSTISPCEYGSTAHHARNQDAAGKFNHRERPRQSSRVRKQKKSRTPATVQPDFPKPLGTPARYGRDKGTWVATRLPPYALHSTKTYATRSREERMQYEEAGLYHKPRCANREALQQRSIVGERTVLTIGEDSPAISTPFPRPDGYDGAEDVPARPLLNIVELSMPPAEASSADVMSIAYHARNQDEVAKSNYKEHPIQSGGAEKQIENLRLATLESLGPGTGSGEIPDFPSMAKRSVLAEDDFPTPDELPTGHNWNKATGVSTDPPQYLPTIFSAKEDPPSGLHRLSKSSSVPGEGTTMPINRLSGGVGNSRKRKLDEFREPTAGREEIPTPLWPPYGVSTYREHPRQSSRVRKQNEIREMATLGTLAQPLEHEDVYDEGGRTPARPSACPPQAFNDTLSNATEDFTMPFNMSTEHDLSKVVVVSGGPSPYTYYVPAAREDSPMLSGPSSEPRQPYGPSSLPSEDEGYGSGEDTGVPVGQSSDADEVYASEGDSTMSACASTSTSQTHADAAMVPASSRLTFYALPGEIRNAIYRLVLFQGGDKQFTATTDSVFQEPPLLRTCKQIRSEAGSIFWKDTKFRVSVNDFHPAVLRRFEERLRWVPYRDQVQFCQASGMFIQPKARKILGDRIKHCTTPWDLPSLVRNSEILANPFSNNFRYLLRSDMAQSAGLAPSIPQGERQSQ